MEMSPRPQDRGGVPNPSPSPSSNPSPYPTTFVQADTTSFKQVVQRLTGSSKSGNNPIPLIKTYKPKPPSSSKLYERRNSLKNHHLRISPSSGSGSGPGSGFSPRSLHFVNHDIVLSPSLLDFPSLMLSPVTPLIPDLFNRPVVRMDDQEAEEKAIMEKGYFLYPSPVTTPRESEPRLLPLFPEASSEVSSSNLNRDG